MPTSNLFYAVRAKDLKDLLPNLVKNVDGQAQND